MSQNKKDKIKRIVKLISDDVAGIYPYFFGIYVVCLVLSLFFKQWRLFFNWPAFHISIVVFGIWSLLSEKGRRFIKQLILSILRHHGIFRSLKLPLIKRLILFPSKKSGAVFAKVMLRIVRVVMISPLRVFYKRMRRLTLLDYVKLVAIIAILIFALYKKIAPINFLVLVYGLVSILFVIESRIAAGLALVFLASCPVLLILKKQGFAETMAIYAYYFLVITVLTQIGEYIRESH